MHRWTPVSSTVPWSTSTSQEVFHVGTNSQQTNRELSPTKESSRSLAPAGSLVSLSIPHFVSLLVLSLLTMGRFKLCSNKCRLRELNGDLQTIASCSIGPGGRTERRSSKPRWTDRCKKDVQWVRSKQQCVM